MIQYDWNETARHLSHQVGGGHFVSGWGVVRLRLVDDSTNPPNFLEDGPVVVAVFGSDNYYTDPKAREVVERVRRHLPETGAEEMGFAVNEEGCSWVLLVGTDGGRYQTPAGKAFQKLLMEAFLDDVVWTAWRDVYGAPGIIEHLFQASAMK
jgi:hypothetical protein